MGWLIVVGYVLVSSFATSIAAYASAKEFSGAPEWDDWFLGVVTGVFWPLVGTGLLFVLLAKIFSRQAQWIVAGQRERVVLAERRLRERRERIAAMERELGIGMSDGR